jgi:hypothetical protein
MARRNEMKKKYYTFRLSVQMNGSLFCMLGFLMAFSRQAKPSRLTHDSVRPADHMMKNIK